MYEHAAAKEFDLNDVSPFEAGFLGVAVVLY
jgi:hypothetical protein